MDGLWNISSIDPKAPPPTSAEYDPHLASIASSILYRSGPDPTGSGGPLFILCAAAFPDTRRVDYNKLLPYVLSILPGDDELAGDRGYSVVFFAGGSSEKHLGSYSQGHSHGEESGRSKINRPAWSWSLQAYNLLGRAVRKKIKRLWIVHERAWVRILFELAQTVVSPKFRKKVVHVGSLTELAALVPLQRLDIPPQVYLHDRKISLNIAVPNPPPPIFGTEPFPPNSEDPQLPLVLIETSRYLRQYHLQVEGLFRISPHLQLLEIVRDAYDRRQYIRLSDYGPHIAAGLIKLYYRSLPETLIPRKYYKDLEANLKTPQDVKRFLLLPDGKGGLPNISRILLTRHLLPLLAIVTEHQEINKMSPANLATCIAPNLLNSGDPMMDVTISRGVVSNLIKWGMELVDELAPPLPAREKPMDPSTNNVIIPARDAEDIPLPKRTPALRRGHGNSGLKYEDTPKLSGVETTLIDLGPSLTPRLNVIPNENVTTGTPQLALSPKHTGPIQQQGLQVKNEPTVPPKPHSLTQAAAQGPTNTAALLPTVVSAAPAIPLAAPNSSVSTASATTFTQPSGETPRPAQITINSSSKVLRRSTSFPASPKPTLPANPNQTNLTTKKPIPSNSTVAASIQKFQAQFPPPPPEPHDPPPVKKIVRAKSDLLLGNKAREEEERGENNGSRSGGNTPVLGKGRGAVVEELRRLYEERARGAEVLKRTNSSVGTGSSPRVGSRRESTVSLMSAELERRGSMASGGSIGGRSGLN